MNGLSPEARAIVEAARNCDDPRTEDRRRVRSSVLLKVGAGVAAGSFTATVATKAAAAAGAARLPAGVGALLGTLTGKTVLTASVVLVAGSTWWGVRTVASQSERCAVVASQSVAAPANKALRQAPVAASAGPGEAAQGENRVEPPRPSSAVVLAEVPETVESKDAGAGLEEEVLRLRRAHTALHQGKPDQAMQLLQDAGVEGQAILAEERAALRVLARCRMSQDAESRAEAERFLAEYPRSPQVPRVRAACLP